MAQQLPKNAGWCLPVSLQTTSILNKVSCRFNVLCPVKRPTNTLKVFPGQSYCPSRILTTCINCLASRQLSMLRHRLCCFCTHHWKVWYLTFIRDRLRAGSRPTFNPIIAACFACSSAVSFPSILLCPDTYSFSV